MERLKPSLRLSWVLGSFFLCIGAAFLQLFFLPESRLSLVLKEAIRLGWAGGLSIVGILFWFYWRKSRQSKHQNIFLKGSVCLSAYILLFLAIANYKLHFSTETSLLPLSLVLMAILTYLLGVNFCKVGPLLRIGAFMFLVSAGVSGFGNWLPQVEGGFPTPEVTLDVYSMTIQQIADEGEKLIFGGIGQNRIWGAIGKAQCPLCHTFHPDRPSKRAPNLWGITARKRLHSTAIEYLAESHICTSCYVVGGFGVTGTEGQESPMPRIHKPPISLSVEEMIAVDTWLYFNEGEVPPSPEIIQAAYKKVIPEKEWKYVNRIPGAPNLREEVSKTFWATGEESAEEIFLKTECITCHFIPGITEDPKNWPWLGPRLTMKTAGSDRLNDPAYKGNATTIREYIIESIIDPNRYIVKDFSPHQMPQDYGIIIPALVLNKMVDYLVEVETEKEPSPVP